MSKIKEEIVDLNIILLIDKDSKTYVIKENEDEYKQFIFQITKKKLEHIKAEGNNSFEFLLEYLCTDRLFMEFIILIQLENEKIFIGNVSFTLNDIYYDFSYLSLECLDDSQYGWISCPREYITEELGWFVGDMYDFDDYVLQYDFDQDNLKYII